MENNTSNGAGSENKLDADTRIEIHLEAIRLVKEEGLSYRKAAVRLEDEYGDLAPNFQHIPRILEKFDGTRESLQDLRGTKNGRRVQFSVVDPAMQMILGHKAAGQGSWKSGRESVFKNRRQLGIPAVQIPSMDQVYYAVKTTPKVFQPDYQTKLAGHYNTERTTAALTKYRPGQLLAADEGFFCYEFPDAKTGKITKKSVFIAIDAGSGVIRKPYIENGDFNTVSTIKGIKTVLGAAPELGIHFPIAPEVLRLDNASFHKGLSVFESAAQFQKALGLPFRIKFSLPRVPKSNPFAERAVGIVRQVFAEPFLHWMELREHLLPNGRMYSQLFDKWLMEFISEYNDGHKVGEKYSRIQIMNMHAQQERIGFDADLIEKHIRVYREEFLHDEGIKLDWETTLDAVDMLEYRFRPPQKNRPGAKPSKKQRPIIIAINPDRIDLLTPAYFKKSERAPLVYIGDLTHVQADAGFTNRKHGFKAETHAKVRGASALLAASNVLAREHDPKLLEVTAKIEADWTDLEKGKKPSTKTTPKGGSSSKPTPPKTTKPPEREPTDDQSSAGTTQSDDDQPTGWIKESEES